MRSLRFMADEIGFEADEIGFEFDAIELGHTEIGDTAIGLELETAASEKH